MATMEKKKTSLKYKYEETDDTEILSSVTYKKNKRKLLCYGQKPKSFIQ